MLRCIYMIRLTRLHPTQPLLKARPLSWEANGLLNPGVTIYDGSILLLYRAIGRDGVSRLGVATSQDGVQFSFSGEEPVLAPQPGEKLELAGVEDPRITYLDGRYAITYVGASLDRDSEIAHPKWSTSVGLAWTHDFKTFDREGIIFPGQHTKNAALLPVRWGERYRLYHQDARDIGLSSSKTVRDWRLIDRLSGIRGAEGQWDAARVSLAGTPLYTEDGWLVFYHGRDAQGVYRLGVMLTEYAHPEKVIAKLPYPVLEPELPFEREGVIPNVVFSCGAVEAGDHIWVYYAGADYAIGGAYVAKKELLDELKKHSRLTPLTPLPNYQYV
jgi:beta-1,2-mannobiose phosphorylase / 1,2-beta-oligomannan phosphorylase